MTKHGPNRLDSYLRIHGTNMERLVHEGVVIDHTLRAFFDEKGMLNIAGEVFLHGNLRLTVEKKLSIYSIREVKYCQTTTYSYNLTLTGQGNVFRYDNSKIKPGHVTEHHKHVFEPPDNQIALFEVGENWPTLSEAIREAHQYYLERLV